MTKTIAKVMKLFTVVLFTMIGTTAFSQGLNKEIGIRFSGIDDLDFILKKEKSFNKFIRYRLAYAKFATQISGEERFKQISSNLGFAIGLEKRKALNDKVSFIHGIEPALGVSFSYSSTADRTQVNLRPTLGYVIGFQLDISDSFYLNVESIPSISANLSINEDGLNENVRINAGFNSNSIAMTIAYRFTSRKT